MSLFAILFFVIEPCAVAQDRSTDFADARQIAQDWLRLLDATQYDRAWKETATSFKDRIDKDAWDELTNYRSLLGRFFERKMLSAKQGKVFRIPTDSKEYVTVVFKAALFGREATETLTLTREFDTLWWVSSYQLRTSPLNH